MTRVIRAASQNVSPSDDASLYRTIYDDGLFEDVSIVSAGAALVTIPAMYGILEGRDFTTDSMQISVELPTSGTDTGSIVVRYDTTTDDVISVVSGLDYSLTYEDINDTGTICEMEIATYTASATAVTAITATYNIVNPHTLTECGDTIGSSTLTTTAQTLTGAINELDADTEYMMPTYTSVSELGLTSGSATISAAFSAMPNKTKLVCISSEFASAEVPSTVGTVEMIKMASYRGVVRFTGRGGGVHQMFLSSSTYLPTGTWLPAYPTMSSISTRTGNAQIGTLYIEWGSVSITPSAENTPTSTSITFSNTFSYAPLVVATPYTSVPGTNVLGVGTLNATTTGVDIYLTRTNTTETVVNWVAIGQIA